jgi:hypothetical protein
MNEFERAMERTQKREQRKTLTLPTKAVSFEGDIEIPSETRVLTVPKEKSANIDAVIYVTVTLPYETFEFSFTKPNVLGMRRLNKLDFQRAITDGLKSILGSVK